jgi:F-type H+-transporting ATPase subunit a
VSDQINVSIKPEPINIFGWTVNNSFFTMLVIMVLVCVMVISAVGRPKFVPNRWQALWEWIIESILNLVEGDLGRTKIARRLFPLMVTIFIFILCANWFSLLPGVGSIGYEEIKVVAAKDAKDIGTPGTDYTYAFAQVDTPVYSAPSVTSKTVDTLSSHHLSEGASNIAVKFEDKPENGWVKAVVVPSLVFKHSEESYSSETGVKAMKVEEEGKAEKEVVGYFQTKDLSAAVLGQQIRPIVRPANADLNMTLSMALISVITANVVAIIAHGVGGWVKEFFPKPYALDVLLTPIEIIGQFTRILSLTFRLFGNVFAGETLVAVILNLAAPALIIFLALEMFFGFIQALVFAILTLVYISMGYHGSEEESHEQEHAQEQHGHAAVQKAS